MEHRCRRGQHCPDHEILEDGVTKVGARIEAPDGFCRTCTRQVERALGELPRDYVQLNVILGKGTTVGGEPSTVRMTKDLPVPLRLHIEALQRDMVRESVHWAYSTAQVLRSGFTPRPDMRPGWLLDRACTLLSGAPTAFLNLRDAKHTLWEYGHRVTVARDGYDGALSFLRLHHKARLFTGQVRLVHRLPVPCPRCEAMALEREDGTDTIDCTDCGRRYTFDEYEQLCTLLYRREVSA